MSTNWIFYILIWQICGVFISIYLSSNIDNFHGFMYRFMFSLTFTNLIAVLASSMLLFLDRKFRDKFNHKIFFFSALFAISSICITLGNRFVPSIIHSVCSMEIAHDVDHNHVYMLTANIIISLLIILGYGMVIIYDKVKRDWMKKVQEVESLKRLQLEARFAILQSKVNPHFLFNTLNTVLDLVFKAPKVVEKVILNLSKIYRKVLNLPDNKPISLKEEIALVQSYLDIEKIRFNDRLNFNIEVAEELNSIQIPPLIIQTLVENAVIHGISPKKKGGRISVSAKRKDKNVEIQIKDDGTGINENFRSSGFGIYGVRERLKLFYKDSAQFIINSQENIGTEINMVLPYEI